MYLLSRVLTALLKWLLLKPSTFQSGSPSISHSTLARLSPIAFSLEATLVWALVMWLFRHHDHTLHASLRSSMQYLYNDSDHWHSWWTLLIHNK